MQEETLPARACANTGKKIKDSRPPPPIITQLAAQLTPQGHQTASRRPGPPHSTSQTRPDYVAGHSAGTANSTGIRAARGGGGGQATSQAPRPRDRVFRSPKPPGDPHKHAPLHQPGPFPPRLTACTSVHSALVDGVVQGFQYSMEVSPGATSGEHRRSEPQPAPAVPSTRLSAPGRHLLQLITSSWGQAALHSRRALRAPRDRPGPVPASSTRQPGVPRTARPRQVPQPQGGRNPGGPRQQEPRYPPGEGGPRPDIAAEQAPRHSLALPPLLSCRERSQHFLSPRARAKVGVGSASVDPVFRVRLSRSPARKKVTGASGKSHPGPRPP
ncbi:hypothetical protein NDU88_000508 [Pleurodeles waltl]|uniref:Uncharacterized protein n=1 Tax=Pleurodeles waltl TaxID=8319 RepID=A0AAV7UU92_PLEWA|nr:hypothetical protein NDU88_000508 [Pleurodeles waltl]